MPKRQYFYEFWVRFLGIMSKSQFFISAILENFLALPLDSADIAIIGHRYFLLDPNNLDV